MLALITLFLGALFFYVKIHFLNICKLPLFFNILFTILLFLGIFNIHITLIIGHKLSFFLVLFLSACNLLLIYFFASTLFIDILKFFLKCDFKYIYLFFLIALPILSSIAVYNAFKFPEVKTIKLEANNFENFNKLNLVQLSDLHITKHTKESRIKKIVETVNKLNPDIIVITGDSVDDSPEIISEKFLPFKDFKAPIYMVFGNHEYYHNPDAWHEYFKSLNINLLENDSVILEDKDYKINLLGIDFGPMYNEKLEEKNKLIDKVFEKNHTDDNSLKIVLTHHPKAFNKISVKDVFLVLSGHTHGGMTFPISTITKLFNGGYLKGLYHKNHSHLYVTSGTSLWSGMMARIGCKNEIVKFEIK